MIQKSHTQESVVRRCVGRREDPFRRFEQHRGNPPAVARDLN